MNGKSKNEKDSSITITRLFGIVGLPLLVGAVTTFIVFLNQANTFAGTFLSGDWKTLFVIVLFLEAFFASIVSALFSLILGVSGAMASGKTFTILEGAIAIVGTTALYGWGFWWTMGFITHMIGLTTPIFIALAVYLLILPVSQFFTFFLNALWSFLVTYLIEFKK
jgi:hypothetical protein